MSAEWWNKSEPYGCTLETVLLKPNNPKIIAHVSLAYVRDKNIGIKYVGIPEIEQNKLFLDINITQFSYQEILDNMSDVISVNIDGDSLTKSEYQSYDVIFNEKITNSILEREKKSLDIVITTKKGTFKHTFYFNYSDEFDFHKSMFKGCVEYGT